MCWESVSGLIVAVRVRSESVTEISGNFDSQTVVNIAVDMISIAFVTVSPLSNSTSISSFFALISLRIPCDVSVVVSAVVSAVVSIENDVPTSSSSPRLTSCR